MKAYWRPVNDPAGLLLQAQGDAGDASRPAWRTERADAEHSVIIVDRVPRMWISNPFNGGESHVVVRDPRRVYLPTSVIPAIATPIVRSVLDPPGSDAWFVRWSKWFAQMLAASNRTPLYTGSWQIRRVRSVKDPPRDYVPTGAAVDEVFGIDSMTAWLRKPREKLLTTDAFWIDHAAFELLPVRRLSGSDVGRVKAFRKQARDRTLPPVLVIVDTVLGSFPILDGHVRLEAAREEGISPLCLALLPTREVRGKTPRERSAIAALESLLAQDDRRATTYESINRAYAALFDNRPNIRVRSRVYSMPGGLHAWEREAGDDVMRAVRDVC